MGGDHAEVGRSEDLGGSRGRSRLDHAEVEVGEPVRLAEVEAFQLDPLLAVAKEPDAAAEGMTDVLTSVNRVALPRALASTR
jgi:hypothetical protein